MQGRYRHRKVQEGEVDGHRSEPTQEAEDQGLHRLRNGTLAYIKFKPFCETYLREFKGMTDERNLTHMR
jgi:hypothetical protein